MNIKVSTNVRLITTGESPINASAGSTEGVLSQRDGKLPLMTREGKREKV